RRASILPPATGLLYVHLTVNTSPDRVFRPVKPTSRTFSVSIPITKFVDLNSNGLMVKLWTVED
ncbi:MAG: hypothetical protein ACKPKO_34795, partial [Candidatus Fonsibacter sp.]